MREARLMDSGPTFKRKRRPRGAKARGLAYERKGQDWLLESFPDYYVPSPWFRYRSEGVPGLQWCQPDGLIIDAESGIIVVVELKLQHTEDAYWQLKWKYLPVLMSVFSPDMWEFRLCEMVKWYDPHTVFPEVHRLRADPSLVEPNEVGVFIWNPQRQKKRA